MEKTRYELKAEVETANVLPKTLQAETQLMPMGGASIPMYAVYGRTEDDESTPEHRGIRGRKVWTATFVDMDEAQAWIQASKVFGRAVRGAVIADQKPAEEKSN